jgi:hypothetical protein
MPLSFAAHPDRYRAFHRIDLRQTVAIELLPAGLIRSPALRALPYIGRIGNL